MLTQRDVAKYPASVPSTLFAKLHSVAVFIFSTTHETIKVTRVVAGVSSRELVEYELMKREVSGAPAQGEDSGQD